MTWKQNSVISSHHSWVLILCESLLHAQFAAEVTQESQLWCFIWKIILVNVKKWHSVKLFFFLQYPLLKRMQTKKVFINTHPFLLTIFWLFRSAGWAVQSVWEKLCKSAESLKALGVSLFCETVRVPVMQQSFQALEPC